ARPERDVRQMAQRSGHVPLQDFAAQIFPPSRSHTVDEILPVGYFRLVQVGYRRPRLVSNPWEAEAVDTVGNACGRIRRVSGGEFPNHGSPVISRGDITLPGVEEHAFENSPNRGRRQIGDLEIDD